MYSIIHDTLCILLVIIRDNSDTELESNDYENKIYSLSLALLYLINCSTFTGIITIIISYN